MLLACILTPCQLCTAPCIAIAKDQLCWVRERHSMIPDRTRLNMSCYCKDGVLYIEIRPFCGARRVQVFIGTQTIACYAVPSQD